MDRLPPSNTLSALVADLLAGRIRVVDLTQTLAPEFPQIVLPPEMGQCLPFRIEEISRYDDRGPGWYWNNFSCGEHTGTHFDAPIHWISGRDLPNNAVDTIPVERLIGPACVIDCSKASADDADFLLTKDHVLRFGSEAIGTDAGQGFHQRPPYPCHYYMHGAGRYGLQCLTNLDLLPPTGAVVIAPPLKIRQGSGSPLRVLALVPGA